MPFVKSRQPTIIQRSNHRISRKWISPNALRVLYRLKESGYTAYLVGGGVRDLLLGREPKDFDIATNATPHQVKQCFRNCRLIGRRFRLAHVYFPNEIIEVATFRSSEESAVKATPLTQPDTVPGALLSIPADQATPVTNEKQAMKPELPRRRLLKTEEGMILRDNVFGTPAQDAVRRDFTVNALFYNIADFTVIDYVGGMPDLEHGLIRIIGDPHVRFVEDPVRMVRAIRFAAMLGFEIEPATYQAMLDLKEKISLASPSRMYEEVLKLFLLGEGEKTYQMLRQAGMFKILFPKLNDWIDTESDDFPHVWISKALDWVDTQIQSGKQVAPHMFFSLLFGHYAAEKASPLLQKRIPVVDAFSKTVDIIFEEFIHQIQIPKKISQTMRDIYASQYRFQRRHGKYPRFFLKHPIFTDAFEYFRFCGELTGNNHELISWWQNLIKAQGTPPSPQAPNMQQKQERRHFRKKRKIVKTKHDIVPS